MEEKQIEVADGKTMNFKPSDVCGTLLTNSNFTGCGVQLIKEKANRTLDTASGGNRQPLIWDGFNQQIRADQTCVGTITRQVGADLKRNGQGIIEYVPPDEQNGYLRKDGCVGTLTTDGSSPNHNNRIVDIESIYTDTEKALFTQDGNIRRYVGSDKVDEFEEGQMATTSFPNGYGHGPRTHNESISLNTIDRPSVKQNYRIRKLTPKECGRLMGVKDEDIDKMSVNQSNSRLYHLYGDSIVVDVLMEIFRELV